MTKGYIFARFRISLILPSHTHSFADQVGDYLQYGASAEVLSDAIFDKEAMRCLDFERIKGLAREASDAAATRDQLLVHAP